MGDFIKGQIEWWFGYLSGVFVGWYIWNNGREKIIALYLRVKAKTKPITGSPFLHLAMRLYGRFLLGILVGGLVVKLFLA